MFKNRIEHKISISDFRKIAKKYFFFILINSYEKISLWHYGNVFLCEKKIKNKIQGKNDKLYILIVLIRKIFEFDFKFKSSPNDFLQKCTMYKIYLKKIHIYHVGWLVLLVWTDVLVCVILMVLFLLLSKR